MLQNFPSATFYSIDASILNKHERSISHEALEFITSLHRQFNKSRCEFLKRRNEDQFKSNKVIFDFDPETAEIRNDFWTASPVPEELQDRRSELLGPVDNYSLIEGFNSRTKVYVAHFRNCQTFDALLDGQLNLKQALKGKIDFIGEDELLYSLNEKTPVLKVCPRCLTEKEGNLKVEGEPVSAALFDFGLYLFNNAEALISKGSGAYFYLTDVANGEEAGWWNEVFEFAEREMAMPSGSIKATVAIDSIQSVFQMNEIIYALRERIAGLAAGSCANILAFIENFERHPLCTADGTLEKPLASDFIQTFHQSLIRTCHKRKIHAISGAGVGESDDVRPDRHEFQEILHQKEHEAMTGFDGSIVGHPRLVSIAQFAFEKHLNGRKNQKNYYLNEYRGSSKDLIKPTLTEEFEMTFKIKDYHHQDVKDSLAS